MSERSIIIIGAGIAGLAAGCYAQMNGFRSQIFELHDLPGGLCTAWERKGFTFDGCIHYLYGAEPGQPFHRLWEELGAVEGRKMIHHDEFLRVVDPEGRALIAYADPDRLGAHLMELSPADEELIDDLVDGVRAFTGFDMAALQEKPKPLMTSKDWQAFGLRMMPFSLPLARWGTVSAADLAERFKDPFLRRAVPHLFGWPEIPVMGGLSLLAYMHTRNAGYPAGGSLEFARRVERRYLALGGQIAYKAQVEKILVENDRAVGVRLYNDEEHRADYVISAADGRNTLFHLLDGQFLNRKLKRQYDGHLPLYPQVQVSLGIDRDLRDEPHWVEYLLEEAQTIGGQTHAKLGIKHYCFDSSLAPAGKSSLIVNFPSPYSYWQNIYGRKLYDTEQLQIAEQVLEFLESRHPGLRSRVEVRDVATPVSYERYTGNWQGSSCGWLLTKETMMLMVQGVSKTLPGLGNFLMAGQWVEPGGGVPMVAMSGRNALQMICAAEDRPFVASPA